MSLIDSPVVSPARDAEMDWSVFDVAACAGLTQDSRQVKPGYLFAALPGSRGDGRAYIAQAITAGASVVLLPEGSVLPEDVDATRVRCLLARNPRHALAMLAARFYAHQPRCIAAVSGTNGKSSVVHFVDQLWHSLGLRSASMGTLGVYVDGKPRFESSMTTPDPVTLHAQLAALSDEGVTHLAMEASSHGLDQYRLDGVQVSVAGFTSFSRDHLDYHGDMEAYLGAKIRLFGEILQKGGVAVLNADMPEFERLREASAQAGHRVLSYGLSGHDIKIAALEPTMRGQSLVLEVMGKVYRIDLPLVGLFQAMNALCALGMVCAPDMDNQERVAQLVQALEGLQGVRGRLERVRGADDAANDQGGRSVDGRSVYVDYAHTPDALRAVLKALRPHAAGRLICVFGCGGNRDRGKRPEMGVLAIELADVVIVTDDNPRSEKAEDIRAEILKGIENFGKSPQKEWREIPGRRAAIRYAVQSLKEGDVLLVAGKGHEQGQIFDGFTEPFDDVEEVSKVLREGRNPLI